MPTSKKESKTAEKQSTREKNFEGARETARINHENHVDRNVVDGNEGVEVRDRQAIEVINPVHNPVTGELEDDTRTLKQSHEEALGVGDNGSVPAASKSDSKSDSKTDSKA